MTALAALARVGVLTFDAAGTLLRPHPSVGAVYAELAQRHGLVAAAAELDRRFPRAFASVSKNLSVRDPEARERAFWCEVVRATFGAETAAREDDFAALFDALWEAFARGERWRLLPGVSETLAELRRRGYRLGVLSNWDRRLRRVLAETGLATHFEHVLISSEVGADKPDPAIFRAAERAFDTAPELCAHVGDSEIHDRAGALAAGWQAVLIGHPAGPGSGGAVVVSRFTDLLSLLPAAAADVHES